MRRELTLQNINEMLAVHSSLESLANSSEKEIQTVDGLAANATVLTVAVENQE